MVMSDSPNTTMDLLSLPSLINAIAAQHENNENSGVKREITGCD